MCVLQSVSVLPPSLAQENFHPSPYSRSISSKTIPPAERVDCGGSFSSKAVKRHQSFHGFQSSESFVYQPTVISQNFQNAHHNQPIPSIFYHLPPHFNQISGHYTVDAIRPPHKPFLSHDRVQSFGNLARAASYNQMIQHPYFYNSFFVRNPFNVAAPNPRVVGRNESKLDARKVPPVKPSSAENKSVESPCETIVSIPEKRFGSLETRKHKCYSPTFYSMRCKKHAKKRSVIYALPKKTKASKLENAEANNSFQNLTDSIQILEQNKKTDEDVPKPAPRCKRHRKSDSVVYQNISHALKQNSSVKEEDSLETNPDSSNNSSENLDPEVSVVEAQIHEMKDPTRDLDGSKSDSLADSITTSVNDNKCPEDNVVACTSSSKLMAANPNVIKPSTESPKGALSLQIQARLKLSPAANPVDRPKSPDLAPSTESEHGNDNFSCVPQMPILNTQNTWTTNLTKAKQVCFFLFFLFYLHCRCAELSMLVVLMSVTMVNLLYRIIIMFLGRWNPGFYFATS